VEQLAENPYLQYVVGRGRIKLRPRFIIPC
jgi:hypothetical protein